MFKDIKYNFRATGMRFILVTSFVAIVIFSMLFVGLILKGQFEKELFKSISESSNEIMEQVEINLDNYFYNMIELSDLLTVNISGNINFDSEDFNTLIKSTKRIRRDVITIALFDKEGKHVSSTEDFELKDYKKISKQEWFTKIKDGKNYINISLPHVQELYVGEYTWVISISRRVGYREGGEYKEGILLIDMNFTVIEELLNAVNLGKRGYVFLINENKDIIYHNQQQLLFSGMKKENLNGISDAYNESFLQKGKDERFLTIKLLNNTKWKLVGVYYVKDIANSQKKISNYVMIVLLFGAAIFITVTVFMSTAISKPILELEKSMKSVENGNFDICLDIKGEYEVVQLSKSFNVMIVKIRNLMDRIIIEQEAKRKSELSALQAQINPHFLYNTLDSIIWMAESGKNDEVIKMTGALASLFRISISRNQMVIPVISEITHAKNYLTIQKMRYKNKFEFKFEVDKEVDKYKIIKLILQPIIENAIYHGIRYMVDKGEIVIRVFLSDNNLIFEVNDDGLGMDKNKLENILTEKSASHQNGVGVRNVHERIKLMYGGDYGLSISSEIEEGTSVRFTLPKNEVSG